MPEPTTDRPILTFITKEEGCSLCDEAFEEIEDAKEYFDFDVEIVKIRKGDAMYDLYWDKIPVILINGKLAFKYRTTRDQLIQKLKARRSWKFWRS
ncbi:MAG: glutaredoxin family protein [Candidatus Kapaibacterium sp.]|jgi:hypothetical protein